MSENKLSDIVTNIENKIAKDEYSKISDELANVLINEENYNKQIDSFQKDIEKLKKDKEMLIQANGNLMQKIPRGKDEESFDEKESIKDEQKKPFDFRTLFDEKGNLKK